MALGLMPDERRDTMCNHRSGTPVLKSGSPLRSNMPDVGFNRRARLRSMRQASSPYRPPPRGLVPVALVAVVAVIALVAIIALVAALAWASRRTAPGSPAAVLLDPQLV